MKNITQKCQTIKGLFSLIRVSLRPACFKLSDVDEIHFLDFVITQNKTKLREFVLTRKNQHITQSTVFNNVAKVALLNYVEEEAEDLFRKEKNED